MLFSDGLGRRLGKIVYAFYVGALGSAVVIATKIPSLSYATGAEGEEFIHCTDIIIRTYTHTTHHTCTPQMVPH